MAEPQLEELVDFLLAYDLPPQVVIGDDHAKGEAELQDEECVEEDKITSSDSSSTNMSSHVKTSLLLLHRDVTGQLLEQPTSFTISPPRPVTPLICDMTAGERSHKYFLRASNKYAVLDAKSMHLDLNVKKTPLAHIMESARTKVVHAMRTGRILVIRMGDVTVDFLNTFNDDSAVKLTAKLILNKLVRKETTAPYKERAYLPLEIFREKGRLLHDEHWASKVYSKADLDELHHCCPVADGFAVIVTTTYPQELLDAYVFTGSFGLPRGLFNIRTFG